MISILKKGSSMEQMKEFEAELRKGLKLRTYSNQGIKDIVQLQDGDTPEFAEEFRWGDELMYHIIGIAEMMVGMIPDDATDSQIGEVATRISGILKGQIRQSVKEWAKINEDIKKRTNEQRREP